VTDLPELTHEEAVELAGLCVLDALDATELHQVRVHLAHCSRGHPEFDEIGAVVPALGQLFQPVDAPTHLRGAVMNAIAAEAAASAGQPERASAAPRNTAPAVAAPGWRMPAARPTWLSWGVIAVAALVVAVLGAWNINLQLRTNELTQRSEVIADAIAASVADGSAVATLRGTGAAAAASGFAAFTTQGEGYILLVGMPPAPSGQTYQAWYLADGQPFSAGVVSVGDDGYALLSGLTRRPAADSVAFTIERAGGVAQPTGDPIVSGEIHG